MTRSRKQKAEKGVRKAAKFSLTNHPFYLFSHIFLYRGRELNRELLRFDLDYARWRVLGVLNDCPDCTMQLLADTAGVERTTLTHTVRLMTEAGLITKAARVSDRRSVVLSLTSKGAKTLRTILPVINAINERCFDRFTPDEVNLFVAQLKRIIGNLTNGASPALVEHESQTARIATGNHLQPSTTGRRNKA